MGSESNIISPAVQFLVFDAENICRLCFASTGAKVQEVSLDDTIVLVEPYIDETVTYADMFYDLGVPMEDSLPQLLCENCATMTTNSYLFKKLCQYSHEKWISSIDRLTLSLNQTDTVGPNKQTIYMMINNRDSVIITSRKRFSCRSKKEALAKVKGAMKAKAKKPHKKIKRLKSKIICEECGAKFTSNCFLIKHMRVHSNSRFPCPQCPKVFTTQVQVEDHTERIHYPKKLACTKCSKMFSTQRMLRNHDKLNHVAAICKLCFVQFPSNMILRAHLDKHDLNKCPRCFKSFMNKNTYKFHLKICGNKDQRQLSFFCDICDKGYIRKNGLRTHIKVDHGFGISISCKWCGKKFDATSKLRNHVVTHTKEKNFQCSQCGGRFVTRAALVYHTRLHTGERPFPCDMCNESFLSASRRMEHKKRKHIGPTKECHVCHVKFVTGHQLKRHVARHNNPQSKLYVPESTEPYKLYVVDDIDLVDSNMKNQQYGLTTLLSI